MEQLLKIPDAVINAAEQEESHILFTAIIDPKTGACRQFWGSIAPVEGRKVLDAVEYTPGEKIDLSFTFNIFPSFFFCGAEGAEIFD